MHYPKMWDRMSFLLVGLFAVSVAECFRDEFAVRVLAVIGVVLFGGITLYLFWNLFLVMTGKAYLKITREGLSYRYGKIASSFGWRDIQGFRAVQVKPPNGKLFIVGISFAADARLTDAARSDRKAAQAATAGRFDGVLLPDEYNWQAAELAQYLNGMKERYSPAA